MSTEKTFSDKTDLVSFTILSNGSEIKGVYQVILIEVYKKVNKISEARIEILDGDAAKNTFEISELEDFVPGKNIEIQAGYHSENETIFKGIITRHSVRSFASGTSKLVLFCNDEAIKMTVGRKNAIFKESTDSDIINKIAGNYGLSTDIQSTDTQHKEVVQYYATDWDFILTRADINGQIAIVDDGQLAIQQPKVSESAVLEVEYGGGGMYSVNLTIDARFQLKSTKGEAWDMSSQATISADGSSPSVNDQGNISSDKLSDVIGLDNYQLQSTAALSQEELKSWADAQMLKSWMSKIQGVISFQGNAAPKPGKLLEIKGLGARFNGQGFISGVIHRIEEGNWTTEAELGLSPDWFSEQINIVAPPTSGLLPGIQGLQIGTVKQINDDPDGETRILVEVPILDGTDTSEGVWARLANFYATTNAGSFFMPETDDEVVLGFLNNDPRFPVILGSLYSSSKSPPYTPEETNATKAIVTKNQLKIIFDDEKKILTLETPGGNKMIFNDEEASITIEDQNSNTIEMSESGISMKSESNIDISAEGNVSISGQAGVSISSEANVETSGSNISNSAEMEFSANAELSATLSASLEVTIQGTMVKIN